MTRNPSELDGIYGKVDEKGQRESRFPNGIQYIDEMISSAYENLE